MKLNRRDLRRLIESVINEEDEDGFNPGSKFAAAEKRGEQDKQKKEDAKLIAIKERMTSEFQETYDWFVDTVFPAIESNKFPIVTDKEYAIDTSYFDELIFMPKGLKFNSPIEEKRFKATGGWTRIDTLAALYASMEHSVIKHDLRVTMQSEQPDEFEEEVAKAKKDNPPNGQANESLSRGSLYRRRYYGRY